MSDWTKEDLRLRNDHTWTASRARAWFRSLSSGADDAEKSGHGWYKILETLQLGTAIADPTKGPVVS
ncbi:MAG TPA: hypothetical protein VFV34_09790 [Blastocatellia bacterium]|nr:hypothetical protein [Blastocatellia bacterium]